MDAGVARSCVRRLVSCNVPCRLLFPCSSFDIHMASQVTTSTVHFRPNRRSRVTGAQIHRSADFCHRSRPPPPPCDTSFCPPNFCRACGAAVAPTAGGFVSQVTGTPAAIAGTFVYCHGHTRRRTGRNYTVSADAGDIRGYIFFTSCSFTCIQLPGI